MIFLDPCRPTPPLSQHFALDKKLMLGWGGGGGGVGAQFSINV